MAEFRPASGSSESGRSSRRQIESHEILKRDESSEFALPAQWQRSEWVASGRSSSMDSGISELPSSPHGTPSPIMPHSPARHRSNSGDQRQNRQPSQRTHKHITDSNYEANYPHNISRPSSSFSNYAPLPHIGQQDICQDSNNINETLPMRSGSCNLHESLENNAQNITDSRPNSGAYNASYSHSVTPPISRPLSTKKISIRELRRQQLARRRSSPIDATSIPNEPPENEPRILLAIKLPSGQRLQRYFCPSNTFVNICKYAELESKQSLSNCNLFINQVPKRLIEDWKQTFHEAGLTDRTLLCLEERED